MADLVRIPANPLFILGKAFSFSRIDRALLDEEKSQQAIHAIQELMRSNTQIVRNWGSYSQVCNISKELYSHIDSALIEKFGFSSANIIDTFDFVLRSVEQSLTQRMRFLKQLRSAKNPKELLHKYHDLIGQGHEEADRFAASYKEIMKSKKKLFLLLMSHHDLKMADNYYFDALYIAEHVGIEVVEAERLLDTFSYSLGDLKDFEKNYIFLDNPIWVKPIIKHEGRYFCPIPQVFFSFIFPSVDRLIERIDKKLLHDTRANYLERKISEIVKRRFPEALTLSGVKWKLNGQQFETDLITFIDSHAIIIEVKSQKITKSASRGAPDRLKRSINDLLIYPSVQSKRLEDRLYELMLDPTISDELRDILPVDLNKIHKVLRVSISLEDFSSMQTNLSQFDETEWLPEDFSPCPTMNLADFETLFDFLEHPVQIIHYLQRRTELLEGSISFLGGELDFMGLYITTLLNLDTADWQNSNEMIISEMSAPLDHYYNSRDKGIIIDKPRPKTSKLFRDIFRKLEERSTPRWTEIGVILYRFSPSDQLKISSYIKDLKKIVNRTWEIEGHKNIIVYTPSTTSEYALTYVLFKDANADRRDEFIKHSEALGFEADHVRYCLIIAKNIDRDDAPYHFIGIAESAMIL